MGVETPIPPEMMNPAAPDGAPPRRIKTVEKIICRFSYFECERPFMCVSTEQKSLQISTKNSADITDSHYYQNSPLKNCLSVATVGRGGGHPLITYPKITGRIVANYQSDIVNNLKTSGKNGHPERFLRPDIPAAAVLLLLSGERINGEP